MAIGEKSEQQSDVKGSAVLSSPMRILVAEDDAHWPVSCRRDRKRSTMRWTLRPIAEKPSGLGRAMINGTHHAGSEPAAADGLSVLRCVRLKKPSLPVKVTNLELDSVERRLERGKRIELKSKEFGLLK